MSRKTCEEYAARCVLLAEETHDASARLGLMGMARGWLRLAQQAEKNTESCYAERLGRSPQGLRPENARSREFGPVAVRRPSVD